MNIGNILTSHVITIIIIYLAILVILQMKFKKNTLFSIVIKFENMKIKVLLYFFKKITITNANKI